MLNGRAKIGIPDRSGLNHVDFSAEDALQAELEFEIPIEQGMVAFEVDEHIDVRRQAKLCMDSVGEVPPRAYYGIATYYLVEGQEEKALELLVKRFEAEKELFVAGRVLLLAAELDKPEVRDKCLAVIAEKFETDNAENQRLSTRYARVLEASLGSTPPKKPDLAVVKKVLGETNPLDGTEIGYVVARAFELAGDRPTAEIYYRKTLALRQFQLHNCTLAGFRLHQEEKDPR